MDTFIIYPTNVVAIMATLAITTTLLNWNKAAWGRIISFAIIPWTRWNAWVYLFKGPDMIQRGFDSCNGRPFEIHAPDNRYVFVSSPEQIMEVNSAPDTVLSLQAASKQMLQPMYSMHGFNWFDRRGTEGVGFIRALRTLLTNHIPAIMPDLRVAISHSMGEKVARSQKADRAHYVQIYPMMVQLVVLANSLSFFGKDLAKNETFMKAALSYVEETLLVAEIIRLVPRCLAPIIGSILKLRASSQAIVYKELMNVAQERVWERDHGCQTKPRNDCIQWIMDTSPKKNPWSAQRVVFELMAIWFGSVHAMATTATFAVEDLCIHPEYVEPLRKELESESYSIFEKEARGLPLLDSFIKESARLTPVEALSTRRQALKPFSLRDGTSLKVGDWLCTPVKALMQSGEHYPQPLSFNGFRFADPNIVENITSTLEQTYQQHPSKLTDPDLTYHVWGTGRMACPGRYYATAIMKVLVAQVILNYDVELVEPDAKRWWTWRSSMLPMDSTVVRFSARDES